MSCRAHPHGGVPGCRPCAEGFVDAVAQKLAEHAGRKQTFSGVCLCCGTEQTGTPDRAKPGIFLASADPMGGGKRVRCVQIKGHDVPIGGDA